LEFVIRLAEILFGSIQQTGKVRVLRGFLKSDEFGSRGGQPLGFQQQVVEVVVVAPTAQ
jgi:hypothetical protein